MKYTVHPLRVCLLTLCTGLHHRSFARRRRPHQRAPEEELSRRRFQCARQCNTLTPFFLTLPLETQISTIEAAFQEFTERKDVAILLINQHVRARHSASSLYRSVLMRFIPIYLDCREDQTDGRSVPASFPYPPRDPIQGPPIRYVPLSLARCVSFSFTTRFRRPCEGLRLETRAEAFRRIIHVLSDVPCTSRPYRPRPRPRPRMALWHFHPSCSLTCHAG